MRIKDLIKTLKQIEKVSGNLEIGIRNDEDEFVPLNGIESKTLDGNRDFCSVSNLTAQSGVLVFSFKKE